MSPNDRRFRIRTLAFLNQPQYPRVSLTCQFPRRLGSGFLHATARFPIRAVGRVLYLVRSAAIQTPGRGEARTKEGNLVRNQGLFVRRSLLNAVEPAGSIYEILCCELVKFRFQPVAYSNYFSLQRPRTGSTVAYMQRENARPCLHARAGGNSIILQKPQQQRRVTPRTHRIALLFSLRGCVMGWGLFTDRPFESERGRIRAQCRTRGRPATSLFLNARRDAVLRRGSGKRPVGMFVWRLRLTDLYDLLFEACSSTYRGTSYRQPSTD